MVTRRKLIFRAVDDLVSDFVYYSRKEDEDLPRGAIEEAIQAGEITRKEIARRFKKSLYGVLPGKVDLGEE